MWAGEEQSSGKDKKGRRSSRDRGARRRSRDSHGSRDSRGSRESGGSRERRGSRDSLGVMTRTSSNLSDDLSNPVPSQKQPSRRRSRDSSSRRRGSRSSKSFDDLDVVLESSGERTRKPKAPQVRPQQVRDRLRTHFCQAYPTRDYGQLFGQIAACGSSNEPCDSHEDNGKANAPLCIGIKDLLLYFKTVLKVVMIGKDELKGFVAPVSDGKTRDITCEKLRDLLKPTLLESNATAKALVHRAWLNVVKHALNGGDWIGEGDPSVAIGDVWDCMDVQSHFIVTTQGMSPSDLKMKLLEISRRCCSDDPRGVAIACGEQDEGTGHTYSRLEYNPRETICEEEFMGMVEEDVESLRTVEKVRSVIHARSRKARIDPKKWTLRFFNGHREMMEVDEKGHEIISLENFQQVCEFFGAGRSLAKYELQAFYEDFDVDQNGVVEFDEVMSMYVLMAHCKDDAEFEKEKKHLTEQFREDRSKAIGLSEDYDPDAYTRRVEHRNNPHMRVEKKLGLKRYDSKASSLHPLGQRDNNSLNHDKHSVFERLMSTFHKISTSEAGGKKHHKNHHGSNEINTAPISGEVM